MENNELVTLTRHLLDLKLEKKNFCKDMNKSIKETETEIKKLVKEKGE